MEKKRRKDLKRTRMMRYFIDATIEILEEEKDISAVTIRKVADRAGYTSATLYNYFDNLTHLIFLANMSHLEEYNEAIIKYTENCKDPVDLYMAVCKCFTEHSFEKPETFELIFFSQKSEVFEEYTSQYYELYPQREKKIKSKFFSNLFHLNSLNRRALNLLQPCIDEGMIDRESATDFTDICLRFSRTILEDVKNRIFNKREATELTLKYYSKLLGFFLKPKFRSLVQNYKVYLNQMGGGKAASLVGIKGTKLRLIPEAIKLEHNNSNHHSSKI